MGHKIGKGGVSMILEYIQKIKDWPVPNTGKEVAMFLELLGYYRTFIPQYSALMNWLNGIKTAEKFMWNEEIEKDFIELKKAFTEEMLDTLPAWNVIPDLMMETEDGRMISEAPSKRKRDEVVCGQRKRRREDDIRLEKHEHSPTVSRSTHNPAGFYSEEWDELQQEDDDWQVLDKCHRIAQMVFCGGCLEIHPSCSECISRSCTQHQGGRCSTCDCRWIRRVGQMRDL